jgi:mannose/fructose/N-acetylgalactosamine-specific phosphotransferase system component IIC
MPVSWMRTRMEKIGIVDSLWALIGGGVAALMISVAVIVVGNVSGYSALTRVESALPTIQFLCSTVATGGVTILALMVTLLGLSHSVDTDLEQVHYHRIQQIAYMAAFSVAASIFLLVFLSIPVEQSDDVVLTYAEWIYYGIIVLTSMLGGLMVTLVLMLLTAGRGLLHVVAPDLEDEPTEESEG